MFTKSEHAKQRIRERNIPPLIIDLLMIYGDSKYLPEGKKIRFFNKRSKQKMSRDLGRSIISDLSKFLNCFLVHNHSNVLVTVGRRSKRIKN